MEPYHGHRLLAVATRQQLKVSGSKVQGSGLKAQSGVWLLVSGRWPLSFDLF
jgi:hypothetical protein